MAESSIRGRDVRAAMQDALMTTRHFDAVHLSGLPEDYGQAAGELRCAMIEPGDGRLDDEWDSDSDGGVIVSEAAIVTLVARHEDPQIRDELAELLLNVAKAALNGLSGYGVEYVRERKPGLESWKYVKAEPPERRITARFNYQYLIDDATAFNTQE